ncbi:MAG: division/cell wall cluster transcriptional repressor MraZ [bacterium]
MFMGEYRHSIDEKGRLIIPAKFRDLLGEHFVVTKGLDNCLFIYPEEEWQAFEQKLKSLPIANKGARKFTRFFLAGANQCTFDKQGRILIATTLREFAFLEKEVVLIGVSNRIEIWSKDQWDTYNNDEDEADMDDIAEQMAELGI